MGLNRRQFLSSSAAFSATILLASEAKASNEQWPVVVVGTGFGGAVTARRLTQAGHQVLMLEMGRNYADRWSWLRKRYSDVLTPDERSMWFKSSTQLPVESFLNVPISIPTVPYAGVMDTVEFSGIKTFVSRAVGGSSVVSGGIMLMPERTFLGQRMPSINLNQFFGQYLPLAYQELEVDEIDPQLFESTPYYQYSRSIRSAWNRAGNTSQLLMPNLYDFEYLKREIDGKARRSATGHEVSFGNNCGKKDLNSTYLARALATGKLTIRDLSEVVNIEAKASGGFVLHVHQINAWGWTVRNYVIEASRVVLAAGSLGTSTILLRAKSRGHLPNLNDSVGSRWGNNGNVIFGRNCADNVGTQQSLIPILGFDNRQDPNAPIVLESGPFPLPVETRMNLLIATAHTEEESQLSWSETSGLGNSWTFSQSDATIASIRSLIDPINDIDGTDYRDDLFAPFSGQKFSDNSYHLLGGVPLNEACDNFGRIVEYPGLYVNDSALIPGAVGVNPSLTIAALAERNVQELIATDFAS